MTLLENIAGRMPAKEHVFISITGGGGKSSLMKGLAAKFRTEGKRVLVTTSTKTGSPVAFDWGTDYAFFSWEEIAAFKPQSPCSVLFGYKMQDGIQRLKAPPEHELKTLCERFDAVICEADGSRHLPLKFHSSRDPVIFPFSDFTIAVMGAWAYGRDAWEVTFGYDGDSKVDQAFLNAYIASPDGLLKGKPNLVLVNGMDGGQDPAPFKALDWPAGLSVAGGSLLNNTVEFEL